MPHYERGHVHTLLNLSRFVVWAEEGAALGNNSQEWSFGNGAAGNIGVHFPFDVELVGLSLHLDTAGAGITRVQVQRDGVLVPVAIVSAAAGIDKGSVLFATPVLFSAGELLGFRTILGGGASDGRIMAILQTREIVTTDVSK